MKKQIGIMLILLATGLSAIAQNERDAFRYAQYSPTGTARYTSLAGSMGAFGSDFSGLSAGNPASIGLFKRFEFTLTPSLSCNRNSSVYNGEEQNGVNYKFSLNNLGLIFIIGSPSETKWKKIHFATGLNNLARYDGTTIVSGLNDGNIEGTTNFFDYVASSANGTPFTSLDGFAGDAFYCWLIDTIPGTYNQYYSRVGDHFNQELIRESSGSLNEYVFSFGGNYDDKLFIGGTLGIPFFNYHQKATYTESRNAFYDTLVIYDEFRSKATGFNLKLGIIYQPIEYLRLGATFYTPTIYPKVQESYQYLIDVLGVEPVPDSIYNLYGGSEDIGRFNYQLRTPYHAMASVAFIYKSLGFINVDYEYVDYTTSDLQSNSYNFGNENKNIKNFYRGTHTIRAGLELFLSPVALRLGYAYSSNPYNNVERDGSRQIISGGIGIKGKILFADLAYSYRFTKDNDVFYADPSINPYTNQITNHFFSLTLGCKIGGK